MLAYLLQLNSIPRVVRITVNIIKDAACTVNAEKLVHIGSCATESQQKRQAQFVSFWQTAVGKEI